jgi:hypothetical protein
MGYYKRQAGLQKTKTNTAVVEIVSPLANGTRTQQCKRYGQFTVHVDHSQ